MMARAESNASVAAVNTTVQITVYGRLHDITTNSAHSGADAALPRHFAARAAVAHRRARGDVRPCGALRSAVAPARGPRRGLRQRRAGPRADPRGWRGLRP